MTLEIERPAICFDTETTGPNPEQDRIVQLGLVKLYPSGEHSEWETLVNPGIPIAPEIAEIHGITDDMVSKAPTFNEIAPKIVSGFLGCDIIGYNVEFDIDMVRAEMKRIRGAPDPFEGARIVDVFHIYRSNFPRRLENAVEEYLGEKMEGAHDALVDAKYTLRVLLGQIVRHELPKRLSPLRDQIYRPKPGQLDSRGKLVWRFGEATLAFGKYNGRKLRDVPRDYLTWAVNKGDFPSEVKVILRDALQGRFPSR